MLLAIVHTEIVSKYFMFGLWVLTSVVPTLGYGTIFSEPTNFLRISYSSITHLGLRNHFRTYEFSTNFVVQYYPPWVTEPYFRNLRIFYEFRSPVLPTLGYGTIFPEPTNFPRNFVPQYYPPWVTEPFFGTYEFLNMPKISHTEYAYDFPYWICLRFPILNMPTISHTEYAYDFPYWICLRFPIRRYNVLGKWNGCRRSCFEWMFWQHWFHSYCYHCRGRQKWRKTNDHVSTTRCVCGCDGSAMIFLRQRKSQK